MSYERTENNILKKEPASASILCQTSPVQQGDGAVSGFQVPLFCKTAQNSADSDPVYIQRGCQLLMGHMDGTVRIRVIQQQIPKTPVRLLEAHGVHMTAEQPYSPCKICDHRRSQFRMLTEEPVHRLMVQPDALTGGLGSGGSVWFFLPKKTAQTWRWGVRCLVRKNCRNT